MADTIARLIFEADSKEIKTATNHLAALGKQSKTTASNVRSLNKALNDQHKALKGELDTATKSIQKRKAFGKATSDSSKQVKKSTQIVDQHGNALKKDSAQVEKLTASEQKLAEQKKIQAAVQRAEIKAYQENAKRKEQAARASGRLSKKEEELTKKNEALIQAFKNASTATATLQGPLNGVSGRLSFIATGLARVGVAGLAFSAGMAGLAFATKSAIDEFSEFEAQLLQLDAMLRSTGNQAGFTAAELNAMANEVGIATLASAGDIRQAQGILLTFSEITGESFERTTILSQDLAQVMGVTAQSAAKTLGKALQDPVNNLASLSRAGITFTEAEKDVLDSLLKTNRGVEAQDRILTKLERRIGGAGAAAGTGLKGAFDGLTESTILLKQAFAEETGFASFIERRTNELAEAVRNATSLIQKLGTAANKTTPQARFRGFVAELGEGLEFERQSFLNQMMGIRNFFNPFDEKPMPFPTFVPLRQPVSQTPDDSFDPADLPETNEAPKATEPTIKFSELNSTIETNQGIMASNLEALNIRTEQLTHQELMEQEHFQRMRDIKIQMASEEANDELARKIAIAEKDEEFKAERIQLAVDEHTAKMERLKAENQQMEDEELRHKAALGDIDAKAALAKKNFEKLTGEAQTKQIVSTLAKRTAAMANMNKGMFRISQMAAIAETVVNTREAMSLARGTYPFPLSEVMAGVELAAGMANLAAIKSQKFGGGGSLGGGGGSGGGAAAASAASAAPMQPIEEFVDNREPDRIVNVTINDSIDPAGARRIVEALNEATEDGLEINALVT